MNQVLEDFIYKEKLPEGFGRFEKENKNTENKSGRNEETSQNRDSSKEGSSEPPKNDSGKGLGFCCIRVCVYLCKCNIHNRVSDWNQML